MMNTDGDSSIPNQLLVSNHLTEWPRYAPRMEECIYFTKALISSASATLTPHVPYFRRRFASTPLPCTWFLHILTEIEALVHHVVEEATKESTELHHHREELTKKVLGNVRTQSAWEDRYRVTRGLVVGLPVDSNDPQEVKHVLEIISKVKK